MNWKIADLLQSCVRAAERVKPQLEEGVGETPNCGMESLACYREGFGVEVDVEKSD